MERKTGENDKNVHLDINGNEIQIVRSMRSKISASCSLYFKKYEIVVTSSHRSVVFWDINTGECLKTLDGDHKNQIRHMIHWKDEEDIGNPTFLSYSTFGGSDPHVFEHSVEKMETIRGFEEFHNYVNIRFLCKFGADSLIGLCFDEEGYGLFFDEEYHLLYIYREQQDQKFTLQKFEDFYVDEYSLIFVSPTNQNQFYLTRPENFSVKSITVIIIEVTISPKDVPELSVLKTFKFDSGMATEQIRTMFVFSSCGQTTESEKNETVVLGGSMGTVNIIKMNQIKENITPISFVPFKSSTISYLCSLVVGNTFCILGTSNGCILMIDVEDCSVVFNPISIDEGGLVKNITLVNNGGRNSGITRIITTSSNVSKREKENKLISIRLNKSNKEMERKEIGSRTKFLRKIVVLYRKSEVLLFKIRISYNNIIVIHVWKSFLF